MLRYYTYVYMELLVFTVAKYAFMHVIHTPLWLQLKSYGQVLSKGNTFALLFNFLRKPLCDNEYVLSLRVIYMLVYFKSKFLCRGSINLYEILLPRERSRVKMQFLSSFFENVILQRAAWITAVGCDPPMRLRRR